MVGLSAGLVIHNLRYRGIRKNNQQLQREIATLQKKVVELDRAPTGGTSQDERPSNLFRVGEAAQFRFVLGQRHQSHFAAPSVHVFGVFERLENQAAF